MDLVINQRKEVYSDPFYVGYYKCQGSINWMLKDGNYFMGCFLAILKGEWDDNLKWPFLYNLKITLVSQVPGVSAHSRSLQVRDSDLSEFADVLKSQQKLWLIGMGLENSEHLKISRMYILTLIIQ